MFNGEQKEAFASASYSEKKREEVLELLALFTPYEESWGYDLLKQHITQLQPAFDEIVKTISATKANRLLVYLKGYRKWFIAQNSGAICSGVGLLKINILDKVRYSMVASPRHLKYVLDEVFEAPEKETVDCISRALLWLAFMGVPSDQAAALTAAEVDFYEMRVRCGGNEYVIPTEALKEFHKLCELGDFMFAHRNPDYETRRARVEGNSLLRGFGESVLDSKRISDSISKWFSGSKWSLTYETVLASGLYYEKYESERFGLKVSFDEETKERLEEKAESNEAGYMNHFYTMRSRYFEKYNQWKALFTAPAQTEEE